MRWLEDGEFYVVYLKDCDAMTFNVIGPVYEGDNIDDRTYELIRRVRNVQICVSQPQRDSRGFHPENYIQFGPKGFKYEPLRRW